MNGYHLRNDLNITNELRQYGSPRLITPPDATVPVRISNLTSLRNAGYEGLFSEDIPGVTLAPMKDAANKTLIIMTAILIGIGLLNLMMKKVR